MNSKKVLIIGTWHLGSVIAACLCEAGHQVYLWDQTSSVRSKWQDGKAPIHEPGLDELVAKHWKKNLFWCSELDEITKTVDWVAVAYDTPINDKDEIIIDSVEEGFHGILNAGFSDKTNFFFTSQLPVGTSRRFRNEIVKKNPRWHGSVTYQPENLRLGQAIQCFQSPDRMVLGVDADVPEKRKTVTEEFQKLLNNHTTPINVMSLESSEMVKHALNSFLATCVVFANEIAEICENTNADAWDVMASLKQDSRVGPKAFLSPGLGFAGGTLARDVKTLSGLNKKETPLNFFSDLYSINAVRNDWVLNGFKQKLGNLSGKKIVLLGITYKPNTSTVRRSPALDIGMLLQSQGAQCVALDPMADFGDMSESERALLPFKLIKDQAQALEGADGIVLITAWSQFKEWNWEQLKTKMKTPLLIDTQNQLTAICSKLGFDIRVPGKPVRSSVRHT